MKKIEMLKNKIKSLREEAGQDGFSLLELVVAVGILLVLTVGGLLAYNGITDNARQAAVDSAASSIHTGGMAYESDNDTNTEFVDAAEEWVGSADGDSISVYVVGEAVKVEHENGQVSVRGADAPAVDDASWGAAVSAPSGE